MKLRLALLAGALAAMLTFAPSSASAAPCVPTDLVRDSHPLTAQVIATPGQVITISHAPSFDASSAERQMGRIPLYWSFDASAAGLSRSEPQQGTCPGSSCIPAFRTSNLLERFDHSPFARRS